MSAMGTYEACGSARAAETWGLVERLVSVPEWWPVWWPLALLVVLWLAVAVPAGVLVRDRWRARDAARAGWWEIIPPRTLTVGSAVSVWHLLAGVLMGTRRGRVSLMFCADGRDRRLHAYLAASAATDPRRVARAIESVLPGAGVELCQALRLPPGAVAAREVLPKDGPSAPVLDHRARRGGDAADEPLRAVLAGLVEVAEAGGFAAVQVVVSRSNGRDGRSLGETLETQVQASMRCAEDVWEQLWTGSASSREVTARDAAAVEDPGAVERRRAADAKRAAGPHLRATVRLVVAGTRRRVAARRASWIAGLLTGMALDSTAVTTRRAGHAVEAVATFRHGHAFVASVRELAAVWHLPSGPTPYGFPASRAGRRAPGCGLPRLDNPRYPRGWRSRDHLRPVTDQTRGDDDADDQHDNAPTEDAGNDDGYGGDDDAA